MRNVLAVLTYFVCLISVSVIAADEERSRLEVDIASLGPQVGEMVPAFRLRDQNGEIQTLESVLGPDGAILLFHRSADW